jgi:hypothetical protein
MKVIISTVNFIREHGLNHNQFKHILGGKWGGISWHTFYSKVRCHSRGTVLRGELLWTRNNPITQWFLNFWLLWTPLNHYWKPQAPSNFYYLNLLSSTHKYYHKLGQENICEHD